TRHGVRGARPPAVLDDRRLLHQCRQPDPVLCDICARTERAGGLRRPGFAGPCRPVRRDRLRSRLHSATWLRALAGNSRRFSDQHSVDGRLRSALPARDRYRLHHDYVGAGRNPLGLAYRWISLTGGDNGLNVQTRPEAFGYSLSDVNTFYYATLIIFLLSLATIKVFVR